MSWTKRKNADSGTDRYETTYENIPELENSSNLNLRKKCFTKSIIGRENNNMNKKTYVESQTKNFYQRTLKKISKTEK